MMLKVNINIDLFKKILNLHPQKISDLYSKFNKLGYWLDGRDKPTYNQLGQVANILNIPFGYFFLSELPEEIYPIPHYRKVSTQKFEPSNELKDTVKILQTRQMWVKDVLLDYSHSILPFVGCITLDTDIKIAVNSIKKHLRLIDFKAKEFSNWQDTYIYLINQVEKAGIFVVINGVVGNNTHRKLDVNEFRGFVLTDNIAPFVFINNRDAKSAQIFTLAHEIAHIWLGKSASFELRNMEASDNHIEIFCNKVAAELLVPEEELIQLYLIQKDFEKLAQYFKVSKLVIARRLLDLQQISKESFFEFYNYNYNKEYAKSKDSGGDFYNVVPYRISKRFGEIIFRAAKEGIISYREAFKLTDLKANTFDKYFKAYKSL